MLKMMTVDLLGGALLANGASIAAHIKVASFPKDQVLILHMFVQLTDLRALKAPLGEEMSISRRHL